MTIQDLLPLLAAICFTIIHVLVQVAFTKVWRLPFVWELEEQYDGSVEMAVKWRSIFRMRKFGSFCRLVRYPIGIIYIFFRPSFMLVLTLIPSVAYFLYLPVKILLDVTNRFLRSDIKQILITDAAELTYSLLDLGLCFFLFSEGFAQIGDFFHQLL